MTTFGSSFILGTDHSFSIFNNQANVLVPLDGKTSSFGSKRKDTLVESDVMDNGGLVDARTVQEGWTLSIEVEKQNSAFSNLIKFLDSNYYNQGPEQIFTIVESTVLPNGNGVEINTFNVCVIHSYEAPDYKKKDKAMVRLQVKAQSRT